MLLGGGLVALIGTGFYTLVRYVIPPKASEATGLRVKAASVGEMTPNSGKIFRFGSKPGILIMTPKGELRAFSAVCTHLECTVQYRRDRKYIWCACHNGVYDLNGRNVSGPPPRPLEPYKVDVLGDDVFVSKGA